MKKPILFITGMDPTVGQGGGSTYVRAHMRAARAAGFESHVFCLSDRTEIFNADFGVVHRVYTPWRLRGFLVLKPNDRMHFAKNWLGALVFTGYLIPFNERRLTRAVLEYLGDTPGPHVIHGFQNWGCVGQRVRMKQMSRGIEVKVITSFYTLAEYEARLKLTGSFKSGQFLQWLFQCIEWVWIGSIAALYERRAYRQSQWILVNYESVRRQFMRAYGAGAPTLKCAYASEMAMTGTAGTDSSGEPADGNAPRMAAPPLILAVSRQDPRKGLDVLIHALADLKKRGVLFRACLASGGSMLDIHRSLARQLGLLEVEFPGWVDRVAPCLRRADIFVLPSLQEGSGSLALLEAMQQGLAIVASDVDGIPEDVTHEESALLFPPGDVGALSAAIERLIRDSELRVRLGAGARARYCADHSPEAFIQSLGHLYAG